MTNATKITTYDHEVIAINNDEHLDNNHVGFCSAMKPTQGVRFVGFQPQNRTGESPEGYPFRHREWIITSGHRYKMTDDWDSQLAISDTTTRPYSPRDQQPTTGTGPWYDHQNWSSQSRTDESSRHWYTAGTGQQSRRDSGHQRPQTLPRRSGASSLTLTEARRGRYNEQPTRNFERRKYYDVQPRRDGYRRW